MSALMKESPKVIELKRWPARIIMVMLMVASLLAGVLGFSARAPAAPLDWIQVNPDGFGDTNNRASYDMEVYDNHLYVGTYNQTTGTEVWRRNDDNSWSQVNTDGFGDAANTYTDSMAVYQGKLYIGTCNFTDGGEVWSYDGATWSLSTASGFGKVANLVIFGMALYNRKL